ncbi:hypothetical protein BKK52_07775 [Rodentibacter trehalosifermentans]|uniref:Uncharacterized protein n=1 Tax=Rodentibacter trehalosifermentans TaxID=1908263 RepID=A0A1V3IZF3_9PAST|nr:hypothetical protein [Rodentibacter trehalosifermentans]OOF47858.1 hypothetical protein BKK52_07775 [Rodentibacter trehalosifermentans]
MSETYLVSQMVKLIEQCYKENAIISYKLKELAERERLLNAQISSFTTSLGYIDPDFDVRTIKKDYDATKLLRQKPFNKNLSYLISQVFKQNNHWRNLYSITLEAIKIDRELLSTSRVEATMQHQCAIGNALRKLYKQGIIERQEKYLHYKIKKRGIFDTSEWRLKQIENEG